MILSLHYIPHAITLFDFYNLILSKCSIRTSSFHPSGIGAVDQCIKKACNASDAQRSVMECRAGCTACRQVQQLAFFPFLDSTFVFLSGTDTQQLDLIAMANNEAWEHCGKLFILPWYSYKSSQCSKRKPTLPHCFYFIVHQEELRLHVHLENVIFNYLEKSQAVQCLVPVM